jgi:hypothetical protein
MGRCKMKRTVTVLLALVASVGISAAAQAQTKKAISIGEVEILDKAAYEALVKITTPEIEKAGGKGLRFFADCCCEKGAPSGQLEVKTPLYLPFPSWATG